MKKKHRLNRTQVSGFKSIQNLEIRDLNVLIGANGAGKSNFIALFKLVPGQGGELWQKNEIGGRQ